MKIEVRADKTVHIEGYVNAVGRDSRTLPSPKGGFVEQVKPKTFQRAIEKAQDIQLKHNHKRVIGSKNGGALELYEDNIGLYAKASTDDPVIYEKAKNKELRGWSFGFEKIADEWEETRAGIPRRILEEIKLNEVSIIDGDLTPCYVGTSIEARGSENVIYETRAAESHIEIIDNTPPPQEEPPQKLDHSNKHREIEIMRMRRR